MPARKEPLSNRAIFLDRDGVLIEDLGYVYRPEQLRILNGVCEGLRLAKNQGFKIIVISNQSGIARGYFKLEDVQRFHEHLQAQIAALCGFPLDAIYVCPHHPQGSVPEFSIECECRKPKTKMIHDATRDFILDLSRCFFIGDKFSDIECAHRSGVAAIQVMSSMLDRTHPKAIATVGNLKDAAELILDHPRQASPIGKEKTATVTTAHQSKKK